MQSIFGASDAPWINVSAAQEVHHPTLAPTLPPDMRAPAPTPPPPRRLPARPARPPHLGRPQALGMAHDATGLPWWATVVLMTVATRACILPFAAVQQQVAARLQAAAPLLHAVDREFLLAQEVRRRRRPPPPSAPVAAARASRHGIARWVRPPPPAPAAGADRVRRQAGLRPQRREAARGLGTRPPRGRRRRRRPRFEFR